VLVNNAGIGAIGAFEATPMGVAREVFETNTFGVMAMTQAVLPQLRARRAGVVVNVTSTVTLSPMLVAVIPRARRLLKGSARRWPWSSRTSTCGSNWRSRATARRRALRTTTGSRLDGVIPPAYEPFAQRVFAAFVQPPAVTTESDVAEAVYRAATDTSGQIRFPAGADAVALAQSK
jgi:NAD(P)-dependent dehydrogenase (short-subunit alcohol dehydrogenase family)